jgi:hypothetical protein
MCAPRRHRERVERLQFSRCGMHARNTRGDAHAALFAAKVLVTPLFAA